MLTERTETQRIDPPEEKCVSRLPPKVLNAEDLFAGSRELRMIYRGEEYRLRITRNEKLILTK